MVADLLAMNNLPAEGSAAAGAGWNPDAEATRRPIEEHSIGVRTNLI